MTDPQHRTRHLHVVPSMPSTTVICHVNESQDDRVLPLSRMELWWVRSRFRRRFWDAWYFWVRWW